MLLSDPDVKGAVRVGLGELVDPGPARHRGGDRANPGIAVGQLGQSFAEHVLIGWGFCRSLDLFAGDHVELLHPMVLVSAGFGRSVALALLGDDMDQTRAFGGIADILEHRDQLFEVVAVDRTDVVEAKLFEQGPAHRHPASELVGLFGRAVERFG